MLVIKFPYFNAHSMFYGGGLLVGLLGAVTLGPAIDRQACAVVAVGVGVFALMRVLSFGLIRQWNVGAFIALAGLVVLSLIGVVVYPVKENMLYVESFLYNFSCFAIVLVLLPKRREVIKLVILAFFIIIAFFALVQVTFLFFGFGMDPTMVQYADMSGNADTYQAAGVRSVFFNSNDFGVCCTLMMLYFIYGCELPGKYRLILIAVLATMIVLSGSRSCLVVTCLLLLWYYMTNWRRILGFIVALVFAVGAAAWLVATSKLSIADSYFGAKIATLIAIGAAYFVGGGHIADGSVNERTGAYLEFLHKFGNVGVGSFKANDYEYIIKSSALLSQDPHSLVIELSLLYGYIGLVLFTMLMVWIYFSMRRNCGNTTAAFVVVFVMILGFVSSSSIGHRDFWILLFVLVCGAYQAGDGKAELLKNVALL